MDNFHFLHS